ncbi:hypothetical protein BROUX41_006120 [Berkeleyomyces rouxiae]|uniref:uncharacterized protein n=1 Tax=Berkeleyomyces rouxiae TaxID=2035830 RepID=UPI003B82BC7D
MSSGPRDRDSARRNFLTHNSSTSHSVLSQLFLNTGDVQAAQQSQASRENYIQRMISSHARLQPPGTASRRLLDTDSSRSGSNTPSMSYALDIFRSLGETVDTPDVPPRSFIPSYLKGSAYAKKLEASSADPKQPSAPALAAQSYPTKSDPASASAKVAPLPTHWNEDDKHASIEVSDDGLHLSHVGTKQQNENETSGIRANCPVTKEVGIYYYEVKIHQSKASENKIGVGFVTKKTSLSKPPGWEAGSYGYHGDDGGKFSGSLHGGPYHTKFSANDIIGCGVNFYTNEVFFTMNGQALGAAFHNVTGPLYPGVGIQNPGDSVSANFGATHFVFDIDSMVKAQKANIQNTIKKTPINALHPTRSESTFMQALVMQVLEHDGHVETARAFAKEIHKEQEALSIGSGASVRDIVVEDDQNTTNRQSIRQAVLGGDMDQAEELIRLHYPALLDTNKEVLFRMQCQRFVEMVRQNTCARMKLEARSAKASSSPYMDIDTSSSEYDEDRDAEDELCFNEASLDTLTKEEIDQLEDKTMAYGREIYQLYSDDPPTEISATLNEIWPMMAYPNPLKEQKFRHLFDRRARMSVAEEFNSAILEHLGKSSRPALEAAYATTAVLLEDLRIESAQMAFVAVEDCVGMVMKNNKV